MTDFIQHIFKLALSGNVHAIFECFAIMYLLHFVYKIAINPVIGFLSDAHKVHKLLKMPQDFATKCSQNNILHIKVTKEAHK